MTIKQTLQLTAWLLLLIGGILVLNRASITHDLTRFLPAGASKQQQLAIELARSGPASRMIMIALENAPAESLAATSRNMLGHLEQSGHFSHVSNGAQLNTGKLDLVFRYRYLLDPKISTSSFSEPSLRTALQQRFSELTSALPLIDSRSLQADPTASFRSVISSWQADQQPQLHQGVWFTDDKQRALLIAITRETGFDPALQQQILESIHAAFTSANTADSTRLQLSGAPVFANNARNTIRSNLTILSIAAATLVSVFLLFAYRSIYLLVIGGLPIVTGFIVGGAVTSLLFSNLHGITLVFGITLLGVAIDYPIHLFSHLAPGRSSQDAIRQIWPTLKLGILTTCIGYLAFAQQDFSGLAQLGIFTTSGLLTAAAVTRWFLPALLAQHDLQRIRFNFASGIDSVIHLPVKLARLLIAAAIAVIVLLVSISPPEWESDLAALSPITNTERELITDLRNALGAPDPSQLIVTHASDVNTALRHNEEVAERLNQAVALGLLSGFDSPSRYLPSTETQQHRQSSIPDIQHVQQQLDLAMQGLPFRQEAFTAFLQALSQSRELPPLSFDEAEATPIGLRIQAMMFESGGEWNAITLLSGIDSPADFQAWWSRQALPGSLLINLKDTSSGMLAEFRDNALVRLLLGILIIFAVLSFGLKSLQKALAVLLPVVLAACLTTALLGAIGERLSLFHLVALLLTAGIGIDYSLFFQRRRTQAATRTHITHALVICAISTTTVFAILATSPIPVLHAVGLTVCIGVPLCFALALAAASSASPATGR